MTDLRTAPLRMAPDLRIRPWAGTRLAPAEASIGEAWLAGPASRVLDGPAQGRSLDELAAELGAGLIGSRGVVHGRGRFPVLVKLIDAAEWLSVQVHPNDAQALALEGQPGIGKSEAWLVLEAGAGAAILLGPRPDALPAAVMAAVGTAELPGLLARREVAPGDRIGVPAGTLHAIGPDLLIYEVQQPCDITYRAWDWGRTGRAVHTEQSRAVTDPAARGSFQRATPGAHPAIVASSPFFLVVELVLDGGSSGSATDGASPHVLTVLEGSVDLVSASGGLRLDRHDTAVVPAALGDYRLDSPGAARVVVASVP